MRTTGGIMSNWEKLSHKLQAENDKLKKDLENMTAAWKHETREAQCHRDLEKKIADLYEEGSGADLGDIGECVSKHFGWL